MRICYYGNADTVLCCYIRQNLLYQQYKRSRLWSQNTLPVSRQRLGVQFGSTGDAMHRYHASKDDVTVQNRLVKVSSLSLRLFVLRLQYPRTISSEHRPSQFLLWIAAPSKRFLFTCTPSQLQRNPLRSLFLSSLHHSVCYPPYYKI
jgi:hypothetical protein